MADGDPRLTLAEVCDLNEILLIRAVNRDRAHKAAEKKAKQNSNRR